MKKLLVLTVLVFLALLALWSCHTVDSQDKFDIQGDSAWTACDTIRVFLLNDSDKVIDTLYNKPLNSLEELKNLPVGRYAGGSAKFLIDGRKNGGQCFEEKRNFDAAIGKVTVDTLLAPSTLPLSISVDPHTLNLVVGDTATPINAVIKPVYASQSFVWSISDTTLATLVFSKGPASGSIKIKPLKVGIVTVKAKSSKDTTLTDVVTIKISAVPEKIDTTISRHLNINQDSALIYVGGPRDTLTAKIFPDSAIQIVQWSSDDAKIAEVDSNGIVNGIAAGKTRIIAKSKIYGLADTVNFRVVVDAPILTITSRAGAAVNVPITIGLKTTQEFGSIVMFKWDLDGDGKFEDSLSGNWPGKEVVTDTKTTSFAKEGKYTLHFYAKDSEGNEVTKSLDLEIGNQPPEILSKSPDTLISINDSIRLFAKVKDYEGTVAAAAWDYEADGKFDDSITTKDSVVDIVFGHRYKTVGNYNAILYVRDDQGKSRLDTVKIKVILDPPVADAGNDTTVMAGTNVNIHAMGSDKFGPITKREIKIGSGAFITVSKQDTTIKPPVDSGKFTVVVRVTDDDANAATDTMIVTVSVPGKSNADLGTLIPSIGDLTPSFKSVTLFYSLGLTYPDSSISLKATPIDTAAKIAINGVPVKAGASSDPVSINVGTTQNTFQIIVTAQDGTQKVYSITVSRAPSAEAQLGKLEATGITLKPTFSSGISEYADTVSNAITSITLKPTTSHPNAKVSVNDSNLVSGTVTYPLPLKVGDNVFKVVVTAQDGKTKGTYTVKVNRRAKVLLSRKFESSTQIFSDSLETVLGTKLVIGAKDSVGYHFTKWVLTEGAGTLADSTIDSTTISPSAGTVRANAIFAINTYLITTSVGVGGVVTPASSVIKHGDNDTLTISPLVGYRIFSVTKDTTPEILDAGNYGSLTYVLKKVSSSHNIVVKFMKVYTLKATATGSGTITPTSVIVDSGSTQSFDLHSTVTGQYAGSLLDNTVESAVKLTGDAMTTSKYTLTGIDANHDLTATFSTKTYTLKVYGHDLCVRQVVSCPVGSICAIKFCLVGSGPDSTSIKANYGSSYNISTADSNAAKQPFLYWTLGGNKDATTSYFTTPVITSDLTYSAAYKLIICCIIKNPPILQAPLNKKSAGTSLSQPATNTNGDPNPIPSP